MRLVPSPPILTRLSYSVSEHFWHKYQRAQIDITSLGLTFEELTQLVDHPNSLHLSLFL